jgi:2-polyprenyl-3-methyl-5-hydroxy-6-metoxy-1,4-benzoquinol methylase
MGEYKMVNVQYNTTSDLDSIVPEYKSKNNILKKLFFKRLQYAFLKIKENECINILDAGCGNGLLSMKLARHHRKVLAIDNNINVVKLQYPGVNFKYMDLNNLNYLNMFHAVTCLDVLEHIKNPVPIIEKLHTALTTNGILIISAPTESFLYRIGRLILKGTMSPKIVGHFHNSKNINKMILDNGFTQIDHKKLFLFGVTLFDLFCYKKQL